MKFGPNIVSDGLRFHIDPANPNSYPGSGTTMNSLTDSQTCTLINGPTFDAGNKGSIVFDGTNDCGRITTNGLTNFANQSFTIDMWVKLDDTTSTQGLFTYPYNDTLSGNAFCYGIFVSSGLIFLAYNKGNGTYNSPAAFLPTTQGNWFRVCVTYTSGSQKMYLNQFQNFSTTVTNTISFSQMEVVIGAFLDNGTLPLNGNVADVKYYDRALTSDEVLQNYNATKSRFK